MADKIVSLLERTAKDDARRYSCSDLLQEELDAVRDGKRKVTKCVVLFLNDEAPEQYDTGWAQAGMSISQVIALMEVIKHRMIGVNMQGGE